MSAKFEISGSASGAVKAVEQLNKALAATEKSAEGAIAPTKRMEEAAKRLAQQADPQLKYNEQMKKLAEAVKYGGLEIGKAERQAVKYQETLSKAGAAGDQAFGSRAAAQLVSYGAGIVSVTGMANALVSAFRDVEVAAQSAADEVISALGVAGELQQMGPESFARGAAQARQLVRHGVVSDLSQGFDIATDLENSGFSKQEIDFIVNYVAPSRMVKAENLKQVGGALAKLQKTFGEEEAGTLKDVLDKSLAVSTIPGVQTGLQDTVIQTLKFADSFKAMGAGDEQTLAAFAGVESVSPSADNAANVLNAFGGSVQKHQLSKGDLFSTVDAIKAKEDAGKNVYDILGNRNAVIGYQRLRDNIDFIREQEQYLHRAGGTFSENSDLLKSDPILHAANLKARASGQNKAAMIDDRSEDELLLDAMQLDLDTRGEERGEWATTRYGRCASYALADLFGNETDAMRAELRHGELWGNRLSPDLLEAIKDRLDRIANATENTSKQVNSRVTTIPE